MSAYLSPEFIAHMERVLAIHSAECLMAGRWTGCPVCEPVMRRKGYKPDEVETGNIEEGLA